jgi:hypothetical protein
MLLVLAVSVLLLLVTTVFHYEVLRGLNSVLPTLPVPGRAKLLVVIGVAFVAHAIEIAAYGAALYVLVTFLGIGELVGTTNASFLTYWYVSAETYTSLGFGDLTPAGPIRLLAGLEALNGLLLIAWSASFAYLSMERFWNDESSAADTPGRPSLDDSGMDAGVASSASTGAVAPSGPRRLLR